MSSPFAAPHHLIFPDTAFLGRESGVHDTHFDILAGRHPRLMLAMRRESYGEGQTTGGHRHVDFLALYCVAGGRGVHAIDDHPYGIARGDVYLMPAGAVHEYRDYQQLEIDAFYFRPDLFLSEELAALRESPGFWSLFVGEAGVEHRLHLSPENFRTVQSQIEDLRQEWSAPPPVADLLLRSGLFRLVVTLARFVGRETPARPRSTHRGPSSQTAVAAAVRICEERYAEPLSVPQLAATLFLSVGHFSEIFRAAMGVTPAAYIRTLRLEKARALLKESDLSAVQIATRTGFADSAHFCREFRRTYGLAPIRYRRGILRTPAK